MLFQKNDLFVPGLSKFCWCQHFFANNQHFLVKIVPSLKQIVWKLCWRFFNFVFSFCKITITRLLFLKFYRLCVRNPASGLLQIGYKLKKWQWRLQFAEVTSLSNFFGGFLFFLSSLVTGPSFMSLSSLVLELCQFSFIRD